MDIKRTCCLYQQELRTKNKVSIYINNNVSRWENRERIISQQYLPEEVIAMNTKRIKNAFLGMFHRKYISQKSGV